MPSKTSEAKPRTIIVPSQPSGLFMIAATATNTGPSSARKTAIDQGTTDRKFIPYLARPGFG
jgi:hypothetical protein